MAWTDLLHDKRVSQLPTSKGEIDNLRSIVCRNLANVAVPGLAADIRFILAYDVARTLSLMIVLAEGYRPALHRRPLQYVSRPGSGRPCIRYLVRTFQRLPMIRNESEYELAGGVSDTDAEQLLEAVRQFAAAESWIAARHPHLA